MSPCSEHVTLGEPTCFGQKEGCWLPKGIRTFSFHFLDQKSRAVSQCLLDRAQCPLLSQPYISFCITYYTYTIKAIFLIFVLPEKPQCVLEVTRYYTQKGFGIRSSGEFLELWTSQIPRRTLGPLLKWRCASHFVQGEDDVTMVVAKALSQVLYPAKPHCLLKAFPSSFCPCDFSHL